MIRGVVGWADFRCPCPFNALGALQIAVVLSRYQRPVHGGECIQNQVIALNIS